MTNATYIKNLLLTCPHFEGAPLDLHIGFLGGGAQQYSIEQDASDTLVKQYLGGDALRRYGFVLKARMPTTTDAQRAANAQCYEQLCAFMDGLTKRRKLPAMPMGATPKSLRASGGGYVQEISDDAQTAVYHMQCELLYYQKARM